MRKYPELFAFFALLILICFKLLTGCGGFETEEIAEMPLDYPDTTINTCSCVSCKDGNCLDCCRGGTSVIHNVISVSITPNTFTTSIPHTLSIFGETEDNGLQLIRSNTSYSNTKSIATYLMRGEACGTIKRFIVGIFITDSSTGMLPYGCGNVRPSTDNLTYHLKKPKLFPTKLPDENIYNLVHYKTNNNITTPIYLPFENLPKKSTSLEPHCFSQPLFIEVLQDQLNCPDKTCR